VTGPTFHDGWQRSAACVPYPLDMFFPTDASAEGAAPAVAVCERCPVKDPCLADALATGAPGIRGGLTSQQRGWLELIDGQVQQRRGAPTVVVTPRQLKPCGTQAAYARHVRRGEIPCARCKRAHSLRRDVA
jgi:WhiB family transcriptional regulator, redox-sensing transcriptional regulator